MKLAKFSLIALMAIVIASCGGGTSENKDDKNNEEQSSENKTEAAAATYALNTDNSVVSWEGSMLGMYSHTGTVGFSEGSLSTENGAITGGEFTVNLTNISTTDSNYKEDAPASKLVGHLQSADFFNTAEFPNATFKITSANGNSLTGDLTIRGVTHEETVENVSIEEKDGQITATGDLTFERKKYDIKWEHWIKENILSNDIKLNLSINGNAG